MADDGPHLLPLRRLRFFLILHPCCQRGTCETLESNTEGAVAAEAALFAQVLRCTRTVGGNGFAIKAHEMFDAQAVNISAVRNALLYEICTQVGAVRADGGSELLQCKVVL